MEIRTCTSKHVVISDKLKSQVTHIRTYVRIVLESGPCVHTAIAILIYIHTYIRTYVHTRVCYVYHRPYIGSIVISPLGRTHRERIPCMGYQGALQVSIQRLQCPF